MKVKVGKAYRLYAKNEVLHSRFAPVDVKSGATVGNLIYATVFEVRDQETADRLEGLIEELARDNGAWVFEYRPVPNWTVEVAS